MTREETIEAVARKICAIESSVAWEDHHEVLGREHYSNIAHAAILATLEAIREPTRGVVIAGLGYATNSALPQYQQQVEEWRVMIDALRKEIAG